MPPHPQAPISKHTAKISPLRNGKQSSYLCSDLGWEVHVTPLPPLQITCSLEDTVRMRRDWPRPVIFYMPAAPPKTCIWDLSGPQCVKRC